MEKENIEPCPNCGKVLCEIKILEDEHMEARMRFDDSERLERMYNLAEKAGV